MKRITNELRERVEKLTGKSVEDVMGLAICCAMEYAETTALSQCKTDEERTAWHNMRDAFTDLFELTVI